MEQNERCTPLIQRRRAKTVHASEQRRQSCQKLFSFSDIDFFQYLRLLMFGYDSGLVRYLKNTHSVSESERERRVEAIDQILRMVPGFRPVQEVFLHYLVNRDVVTASALALLYPLPYTCFFIYLQSVSSNLDMSLVGTICLVGMRCSVIALLCKYCLHFPKDKYNWVIHLTAIIIGFLFRSNYIFILLYLIGIFLAYYSNQDGRMRTSQSEQHIKTQEAIEENSLWLHETVPSCYPSIAIGLLIGLFLLLWVLSKYYDHDNFSFLQQFYCIGLLKCSQQATAFFPLLAASLLPAENPIQSASLIGISYILPGPSNKFFFLLLGDHSLPIIFLAYLSLYLPSILMMCTYFDHRQHFHSIFWLNSKDSIQSVSNGLVFITLVNMLAEENCLFKVVFYTSIVLLSVNKLYKFNEIITSLLGIFLIFSRATVLKFNKNFEYNQFFCRPE